MKILVTTISLQCCSIFYRLQMFVQFHFSMYIIKKWSLNRNRNLNFVSNLSQWKFVSYSEYLDNYFILDDLATFCILPICLYSMPKFLHYWILLKCITFVVYLSETLIHNEEIWWNLTKVSNVFTLSRLWTGVREKWKLISSLFHLRNIIITILNILHIYTYSFNIATLLNFLKIYKNPQINYYVLSINV